MALTAIALCNQALNHLGAKAITALDGTDTSDEAEACINHYETTRDALLRRYPWRFACRWSDLVRDTREDYGTAEAGTATTIQDTDKAWTPDDYIGYYVYLSGGTGAGQVRAITDNDADTLTVATWGTTPDSTTTYEIWENVPPYPWDYQYDLPTDFLRMVETDPDDDLYEIEGALFRTNQTSAVIQYVRQVTDPGEFDPLFVEALAYAVALKICMPIMKDKVRYAMLEQSLATKLSEARLASRMDARRTPQKRSWLDSRGV